MKPRSAINAAPVTTAIFGLGVALVAKPDALAELASGALVRLLPDRYADAGAVSAYYAGRTRLLGRTRAFVDLLADAFRRGRLADRFAGSPGA